MFVKNKLALFAIALTSLIGSTLAAQALVLQVSATAMVLRTTLGSGDKAGDENKGLLGDTGGRYFAAVMFPTSGDRVCRFAVIHRDNDGNNITARLTKKPFTLGTNTGFDPPIIMAEVTTNGASQNTRQTFTTVITQPLITTGQAFYYIELEVPDATNVDVLGFQINVLPTCP